MYIATRRTRLEVREAGFLVHIMEEKSADDRNLRQSYLSITVCFNVNFDFLVNSFQVVLALLDL